MIRSMIVYFSIMINNAFSAATYQSVHYAAMEEKKEIKSIDRPENNNNNRNNDNKWTGATVRPPRGIGGDLLRETRHRRRSEAGTTCKSEPPFSPCASRRRDREERASDRARNRGRTSGKGTRMEPDGVATGAGVSEEEEVRGSCAIQKGEQPRRERWEGGGRRRTG